MIDWFLNRINPPIRTYTSDQKLAMKLSTINQNNPAQTRVGHAGERMRVHVRGLRLNAEVGAYDNEHGRTQPIKLDMEAEVASIAAHPQGSLDDAVNYAAMAETARQIVGSKHHDLLEDLAQKIADTVFADPRIMRLAISIEKLEALDDADSVGVSLERWR